MPKTVRILHAADFHLDSPFQSLPPEQAALRRAEQRALVSDMADLAEKENVSALLLAGDLFDAGRAYYETGNMLVSVFGRMKAHIFIAPGNHDFYSARSPYAVLSWPENVHIFSSPVPEAVRLPELGIAVWGSAFTDISSPPPIRGVNMADEDISIGVFHGEVTNSQSAYGAVSDSDIENSGLDYLALGHVHSYSGVMRRGNTFYAYPGCPEGRGFDEPGEKGVIVGNVGKGICDLRFVSLGRRRYETVTAKSHTLQEIEKLLPSDTAQDIYRIILTGETDSPVDTEAIEEALADRFFSLTVRDETLPRRDVWDSMDSNTLKGLFLRKMHGRFERAESEKERNKIMLAVRYALAAMENGEEVHR